MGKFALLIGISEYKEGLSALPSATKDTVALQKVLEDPDLGGFDEVKLLSNPNSGEMARTIELWSSERATDDLILLFFSGHGIKDDRTTLYFAANDTQKRGSQLVRSTAMAADTLNRFLKYSKPRKQVIILDCCFSGAYGTLSPKDDGDLDFQSQLGAEGRVVMTSTGATDYAFEEKEQETSLSVYTRYLVEGIEKGTTTKNINGFTTVRELHNFVSRKVKATAPAMSPDIIVLDGKAYDIPLARTPKEIPELRYRRAVEKRIRGKDKLTSVSRRMLEAIRNELKISEEAAAAVEADLFQPFKDYERKRTEYREGLLECLKEEKFIDRQHIIDLKDYQKYLGLKDEDVRLIEKDLIGRPLTLAPEACTVIPSLAKNPGKSLILIDTEIAEWWGCRKEEIHVHQGYTLADIDVNNLEGYRSKWKDACCVTSSDLFLAELVFISGAAKAIPGGLMPNSQQTLVFEGKHITPLIPVNSLLLDHFTAEELVSRMQFCLTDSREPQVQVSLDLPLTGVSGDDTSENYRLTRIYPLKKRNALATVPVLELWPNFQVADWKEYYALFFDLSAGDLTFHVKFPKSVDSETFQDEKGGHYGLTKMEIFPPFIECLDQGNKVIGLVLPKPPPKVSPHATWKVGVDFGTSFTNIYIGRSGKKPEPLMFDETLLAKVTDSPTDSRLSTLFNYFIPDCFLPAEKPLPLSSMLTTRGNNRPGSIGERAILDGRIYNPNNIRGADLQEEWIETDLKWRNFDANWLFLRHLILHISANAMKQGANSINWTLSYPSAFSRNEQSMYMKTWTDLLRESQPLTGITHQCSTDSADRSFRTESLSAAQYFIDYKGENFVSTTCIDIGGGTSDISIWQDETLLHQCSVKFAGRDFFSNFLSLNPKFIAERFEQDPNEWVDLRGDSFHSKLDVLLRWKSEEWLARKRPYLTGKSDMVGLLRLMALGIGGLYYYVGLVIKVLRDQGTYSQNLGTPVYLAGNGSRLLNWLDGTGSFTPYSKTDLLLNHILSRGANVEDTKGTQLSSQPKEEVACGLVLDKTRLAEISRRTHNELILGEACLINGIPHNWNQPINMRDVEEDIESFAIPNLDNLSAFLYTFHESIEALELKEIRPLPGYNLSLKPTDNAKIWRGTMRSLDKVIQESNLRGEPRRIQMQPTFILGLKALLNYLGKQWAEENA